MTDEKAIEKMLYDQQQGWPLCPRCGERMPDKLTHGALSRHAKGVYICEACGTDEALRDWIGNVKPLSDWVLVRVYNGDLRPAGLYPDQQAGIHVLQGNLPLVRLGTPEHEVRRW